MTQELKNQAIVPQGGSGAMFDRIAERYDLLNRVISLGVDQGWRKKTVAALDAAEGARVLDLATGTADLALMIAQRTAANEIIGLDPSANMLTVGRRKLGPLAARIELVQGDAQRLPFADASFDGLTMAFGIRNVPDRPLALREMARVVKPGAKVCILELSEPKTGLMSAVARFHMHRVVPQLGAWLSGEREYRYLPASIAAFPSPKEFGALMTEAGLCVLQSLPLTFGVCHLYVATPATAAAGTQARS